MRVLISWVAFNNDFLDGQVNAQGPTCRFHELYYEQDKHIILSAAKEDDTRAILLENYLAQKYAGRTIQVRYMNISDVISVEEIQAKINQLLIELREDQIDIFISPGTPAMQVSWYLSHASLGLNTRLLQTRPPAVNKKKLPALEVIDLSNAEIPNLAARKATPKDTVDKGIIKTDSIKPVYDKALKASESDGITVLIKGESGTGKENLARYIHTNSIRKSQPYITVNCSSMNDQLLESRLFGYKKGSFTGADEDTKGLFEEANGGTIFLDEIGDISPYMQQLLLRVLQEKTISPVGGKEKKIDVRIVAASHKDLVELCNEQKFRWDLYYRLAVVELELPALRERGVDDLKSMINHFIKTKKKEFGKDKQLKLSKDAKNFLLGYSFPGNIRELENMISSLYVFCEDEIELEDLPKRITSESNELLWNIKFIEKDLIERALRYFKGNRTSAAKAIGWSYNTLNNKVKDYKLEGLCA